MKHILFISRGMSYGGSGRCISVFSKRLAEAGFKVSLLILRDYATEYDIDSKINVIRINLKTDKIKVGKVSVMLKWFPAIIKYIGVLKPDVVIPFGVDVCILSVLGNFGRSKICVTVRSSPDQEPPNPLFRAVRDIAYRFAQCIWVQNDQQRQLLPRLQKVPFITVPNPVRADIGKHTFQYSGEIKKFITLGRLCEGKNQKILIDAFKMLAYKYENITLEIYGEGELREVLEKQIAGLHLEEAVLLKGRTERAIDVLKTADAYVLCSKLEGMPNGLMEAMALGIPCIATDCNTGPKDLIINNENGILVPNNDTTELYKAMEFFIDNPDTAIKYGQKGKEFIWSQYDESTVSENLITAMQKMCDS